MEKITIPFEFPPRAPSLPDSSSRATDSLEDLRIGLKRLANFVGEMLVAAHQYEQRGETGPHRPKLHDWPSIATLMGTSSPVPVPEVELTKGERQTPSRSLPRALYYSVITQLVSAYENYLSSIAEEAYLMNERLLARDEHQLTSREIVERGAYDRILELLAERAVRKLTLLAYPARVARFQSEFHLGIHHEAAPGEQAVVHELHRAPEHYCSRKRCMANVQYAERLAGYSNASILAPRKQVPVDFKFFFDRVIRIEQLATYLDERMRRRWFTSSWRQGNPLPADLEP